MPSILSEKKQQVRRRPEERSPQTFRGALCWHEVLRGTVTKDLNKNDKVIYICLESLSLPVVTHAYVFPSTVTRIKVLSRMLIRY